MKYIFVLTVITIGFLGVRPALGQGTFTAIASNSWTNTLSWSHTGIDGDNIPDADDIVTIPSPRTITMPAGAQQVASLTIQNGGTLNMSTSGAVLEIFPSGGLLQVNTGGTIQDSNTNTEINFLNTGSFVLNGIVQADFLQFEGTGQTVTITGGGTLLVGRINLSAINITVNLNTSGSFGSNVSPLTLGNANSIIAGTGTLNIGGGQNFNVSASGTSIGCTINTADISILSTSSLTITNGGEIVAGDDLRVGPNADASNSTITVNSGGTLTITGDVLFDEANTGVNADNFTLSNSGAVSIVGSIDLDPGAASGTPTASAAFTNSNSFTLGGSITNTPAVNPTTFTNNANATFSIGGNIDTDVTLTFTANGNIVDYNGGGAQNIASTTYHHLTLSNAGAKSAIGGIAVGGDWSVSGATFTEGTQTVTFNGTGTQTIKNASGESFYNLVLNKASGRLVLSTAPTSTDITIVAAGTMTFTNGVLATTTNESLTFSATALVSGGTSTSYVDGPVGKLGTAAFVFPIGSGTFWARLATGANSGNATTLFLAQYFSSVHSDPSVSGLLRISSVEYWSLTRSGTAANATVSLYWESATRSGITSATTADLRVARYNGTDWVDTGVGTISASPAFRTSPSITSGLFTFFTFGSNTALPTNPLPIELLDFSASLKSQKVELNWTTASELNNDYFTIERASDIERFEEITVVKGQGRSSSPKKYETTDPYPLSGISYYRLKQTDFDGKFTYSELKKVEVSGIAYHFMVYPNPAVDNKFNVDLTGINPGTSVPLEVLNSVGVSVFESTYNADQNGRINATVDLNAVSSGIYILNINAAIGLRVKILVR